MDEAASKALADFIDGLMKRMDAVYSARGKEAETAGGTVNAFIEKNMRDLIGLGIPVAEIQKAVQAATDRVPQTRAPDSGREEDGEDEGAMPPLRGCVCFVPADGAAIAAFAAGGLDGDGLMDRMLSDQDETCIEMPDGLDIVLTDYGRDPSMDDVTGGGEVVAGPDGEAFIPGLLDIGHAVIGEPMVFKAPEEVKDICKRLAPITEKEFKKRADIKKLIKHWLVGYDPKSAKREAEYIIDALLDEFIELRGAYRQAAEEGLGMAVYVRYELIDDEE
ncbi:MAG: YfbM family protein [Methanomassiliicoccaceae archaeon]|nr:YfbM family protein [Methanomassiliicoccaceae archaeon]